MISNKGPTGVCPGTQYCSELRDHDFGCKQVASVKTPAQPGNIPTESTASASWMTGDAVLMNQDTFHRGWKHDLPDGPDRGKEFSFALSGYFAYLSPFDLHF